MSILNQIVAEALRQSDVNYLTQVLNSRTKGHPEQKGSEFSEIYTLDSLRALLSEGLPVRPSRMDPTNVFTPVPGYPCQYFEVDVRGYVGVMPLQDLPGDTLVHLLDPKGTCGTPGGGVQAHLPAGGEKLALVDFSTIILGPDTDRTLEDGTHPYVLWTIHPGLPSGRYEPIDRPDLVGAVVTAADAIDIGLKSVNLR